SPGIDGQDLGEARPVNHQGVVAAGLEGVRGGGKEPGVVVADVGRGAVDGGSADNRSAKSLTDGLVTQADAQDGEGATQGVDGGQGDAGLVGGAGARGDDQAVVGTQLLDGGLVVAEDF